MRVIFDWRVRVPADRARVLDPLGRAGHNGGVATGGRDGEPAHVAALERRRRDRARSMRATWRECSSGWLTRDVAVAARRRRPALQRAFFDAGVVDRVQWVETPTTLERACRAPRVRTDVSARRCRRDGHAARRRRAGRSSMFTGLIEATGTRRARSTPRPSGRRAARRDAARRRARAGRQHRRERRLPDRDVARRRRVRGGSCRPRRCASRRSVRLAKARLVNLERPLRADAAARRAFRARARRRRRPHHGARAGRRRVTGSRSRSPAALARRTSFRRARSRSTASA